MAESLSFSAKNLLSNHKIHLKKSLGQNLMVDKNIVHKILCAAALDPSDTVIEIGCGTGILTKELSKAAEKVISFEIDKYIIVAAKDYLIECPNIEIINADFLKYDFEGLIKKIPPHKLPLKIVANLPYYITSPLIEKIIVENEKHSNKLFSRALLTVQKEFAQRMIAKAATKDYGSFTLFVNYYCEPYLESYISKSSFFPAPKVDSAIVNLKLLDKKNITVANEKLFFAIIRAAFGQRRKTLRNALISKFSSTDVDRALLRSEINSIRRGETLSLPEFAALADNFDTTN